MADTADAISMAYFQSLDLVIDTKPDLTPVTEADRQTEKMLRQLLSEQRPLDSVLGEEFGVTGHANRQWIIDPIDGTKNYVRGVPVWATLIALALDDVVVLGVVSAPALGRRWWARVGDGAWVSTFGAPANRLRVSSVRALADASLSYSDSVGWEDTLPRLAAATWRQRAYGDFWSHMLVAEGAVDISVEPTDLAPYDVAALIPIVQEAGGQITAYDGGPALSGGSAVATNGLLHAEVLRLLAN
ncbi:MAG: histidinol phosphatase [Actinomycetota bacterium]|nr:histidinol phosphatase [Actinomycetota bacterium]